MGIPLERLWENLNATYKDGTPAWGERKDAAESLAEVAERMERAGDTTFFSLKNALREWAQALPTTPEVIRLLRELVAQGERREKGVSVGDRQMLREIGRMPRR